MDKSQNSEASFSADATNTHECCQKKSFLIDSYDCEDVHVGLEEHSSASESRSEKSKSPRLEDNDLEDIEVINCQPVNQSSEIMTMPHPNTLASCSVVGVTSTDSEEEDEVVFVKAVKKQEKLKNVQLIDISDDPTDPPVVVVQQNIPPTKPKTDNLNAEATVIEPQNANRRRTFLSPQGAASDLVRTLLSRGIQRARLSHQIYFPWEKNILNNAQYQWLSDFTVNRQGDHEEKQVYCWRVRNYTRNALFSLARQMSCDSILGRMIMMNFHDHNARKYQHNMPTFGTPKNNAQAVSKEKYWPTTKTDTNAPLVQVKYEDLTSEVKTKIEPK
ncbi:Hypothetical predicted protein [Cloeon dipterum]|uniref:Uncharacterized protein n=1 Tax=Cloeon dipterum TaxID=197152 RepID=A0A8S1CYF8_9INSE|nr:Hypothetical predicted protein [Cloeon dipterum]